MLRRDASDSAYCPTCGRPILPNEMIFLGTFSCSRHILPDEDGFEKPWKWFETDMVNFPSTCYCVKCFSRRNEGLPMLFQSKSLAEQIEVNNFWAEAILDFWNLMDAVGFWLCNTWDVEDMMRLNKQVKYGDE